MLEANDQKDRPKLSARQQVAVMKEKGVRFELTTETMAERILRERNYYFKLKAYAK